MTYEEIVKKLKRRKGLIVEHDRVRLSRGVRGAFVVYAPGFYYQNRPVWCEGKSYPTYEAGWNAVYGKKTVEKFDSIENPQHYTFTRPCKDCWDVLQQSELLEDHLVASAVQYLLRCKKKGNYKGDLKKAAAYIKKALNVDSEKERSTDKNQ